MPETKATMLSDMSGFELYNMLVDEWNARASKMNGPGDLEVAKDLIEFLGGLSTFFITLAKQGVPMEEFIEELRKSGVGNA